MKIYIQLINIVEMEDETRVQEEVPRPSLRQRRPTESKLSQDDLVTVVLISMSVTIVLLMIFNSVVNSEYFSSSQEEFAIAGNITETTLDANKNTILKWTPLQQLTNCYALAMDNTPGATNGTTRIIYNPTAQCVQLAYANKTDAGAANYFDAAYPTQANINSYLNTYYSNANGGAAAGINSTTARNAPYTTLDGKFGGNVQAVTNPTLAQASWTVPTTPTWTT